MDKDINRVVGGKYCGAEISWVNNSLAFVGSHTPEHAITRENVVSVVKLEQQDGNVAQGAFWGGITGAIIAKDIGGFIMAEIKWIDGNKSLVKAAKGAYEIILSSSYQSNYSVVEEQRSALLLKQIEEEQREARKMKWDSLSSDKKKEIIERMRPVVEQMRKKPKKMACEFSIFFLVLGILLIVLCALDDLIIGIVFGAIVLVFGILLLVAAWVISPAKKELTEEDIVSFILSVGVPEIK